MEKRPSCICIRKRYVKRKKFRTVILYAAWLCVLLLCGVKFLWSCIFSLGLLLICEYIINKKT